jgi:hypothetical protein
VTKMLRHTNCARRPTNVLITLLQLEPRAPLSLLA